MNEKISGEYILTTSTGEGNTDLCNITIDVEPPGVDTGNFLF